MHYWRRMPMARPQTQHAWEIFGEDTRMDPPSKLIEAAGRLGLSVSHYYGIECRVDIGNAFYTDQRHTGEVRVYLTSPTAVPTEHKRIMHDVAHTSPFACRECCGSGLDASMEAECSWCAGTGCER